MAILTSITSNVGTNYSDAPQVEQQLAHKQYLSYSAILSGGKIINHTNNNNMSYETVAHEQKKLETSIVNEGPFNITITIAIVSISLIRLKRDKSLVR